MVGLYLLFLSSLKNHGLQGPLLFPRPMMQIEGAQYEPATNGKDFFSSRTEGYSISSLSSSYSSLPASPRNGPSYSTTSPSPSPSPSPPSSALSSLSGCWEGQSTPSNPRLSLTTWCACYLTIQPDGKVTGSGQSKWKNEVFSFHVVGMIDQNMKFELYKTHTGKCSNTVVYTGQFGRSVLPATSSFTSYSYHTVVFFFTVSVTMSFCLVIPGILRRDNKPPRFEGVYRGGELVLTRTSLHSTVAAQLSVSSHTLSRLSPQPVMPMPGLMPRFSAAARAHSFPAAVDNDLSSLKPSNSHPESLVQLSGNHVLTHYHSSPTPSPQPSRVSASPDPHSKPSESRLQSEISMPVVSSVFLSFSERKENVIRHPSPSSSSLSLPADAGAAPSSSSVPPAPPSSATSSASSLSLEGRTIDPEKYSLFLAGLAAANQLTREQQQVEFYTHCEKGNVICSCPAKD